MCGFKRGVYQYSLAIENGGMSQVFPGRVEDKETATVLDDRDDLGA